MLTSKEPRGELRVPRRWSGLGTFPSHPFRCSMADEGGECRRMHLGSPLSPSGFAVRPGRRQSAKRSAVRQVFIMNTDQIGVILKRFETPDETRVLEKGKFELVHLG